MSEDSDFQNGYGKIELYILLTGHSVAELMTFCTLLHAIYHLFINPLFQGSKYVTYAIISSLTFNFICCSWALYVTIGRAFISGFPGCPMSIQLSIPIGLSRLFLYYFFVARYAYTLVIYFVLHKSTE